MEALAARPPRSAAGAGGESAERVVEPERPRVEARTDAEPATKRPLPIPPLPERKREALRFDPLGKRIPRADRWSDEEFQWETPVLPSSELPPPPRVRPSPGPFAARLQSVLEDRPEAVDRLCAAAQARAAVRGDDGMQRELSAELASGRWQQKRLPPEQAKRLHAVAGGGDHPASWRSAARLILDFFVSGAG
jgi:hypothetical protein